MDWSKNSVKSQQRTDGHMTFPCPLSPLVCCLPSKVLVPTRTVGKEAWGGAAGDCDLWKSRREKTHGISQVYSDLFSLLFLERGKKAKQKLQVRMR